MSSASDQCPICGQIFDSLRSVHLHCIQNHPEKFICCPICYLPFKAQSDFVKHANWHHNRLTKQNIGIQTDDFKAAVQYEFNEQMINGKMCMVCLKCLSTSNNAHLHYKWSHLRLRYLCHRCPQLYASLQHLRHHYRAIHESKSIGKCIRTESSFSGFTIPNMHHAKNNYMKRIGLQGQSVLQFSTRNQTAAVNPSSRVKKWKIDNCVDRFPMNEITSHKTTYRNQMGIMKLLPNELNDFSEAKANNLTLRDDDYAN